MTNVRKFNQKNNVRAMFVKNITMFVKYSVNIRKKLEIYEH